MEAPRGDARSPPAPRRRAGKRLANASRHRAGTASVRDAADGTRTASHTLAADSRASELHFAAVSPNRHRERNKTGSPFPATPGAVSSVGGASNDGGASMTNLTNTRASSQNIKKILQQEKITDCEPGVVKSVRTSSGAQKYGSPRSGRNGLLKSGSNSSFDFLPRNTSSSDRLNGLRFRIRIGIRVRVTLTLLNNLMIS